jgi:hypothetical protein
MNGAVQRPLVLGKVRHPYKDLISTSRLSIDWENGRRQIRPRALTLLRKVLCDKVDLRDEPSRTGSLVICRKRAISAEMS